MTSWWVQGGIVVLSVCAIWMVNDGRAGVRRWAPLVGLLGQPFWFLATWQAEQWGMFAITFVYTGAWVRGLWTQRQGWKDQVQRWVGWLRDARRGTI